MRAPRLHAETRSAYLTAEQITEDEIRLCKQDKGRRILVLQMVDEAFRDAPAPVHEWLEDAVWRWLLTATTTMASTETYLHRFRRWVTDTDKRGLEEQFATRPPHVEAWVLDLQDQGLAQRTVRGYLMVVRSWFSWLEDRGHILKAPVTKAIRRLVKVDEARVTKANGIRQVLSRDEATRIAQWCLHDARPVEGLGVLLLLCMGLRSAEVARLEKRHLKDREGTWYLTVHGKGDKTRVLELDGPVVRAVHRYWRSLGKAPRLRGPLLVSHGGSHYTPREVQQWAKKAAAVVGREGEISSHDFRKTTATLLVESGFDLFDAKEQLGHSNINTTRQCYVVSKSEKPPTIGLEINNES